MTTLESIQEDILDLRELILEIDERIWHSIDHQNPEALSAFIEKKSAINEKLRTFRTATEDLLHAFAAVEPTTVIEETEPEIQPVSEDDETIAPIDRSFRFLHPTAMILEGTRIGPLNTWQAIWKRFLKEFLNRHPDLFQKHLVDTSCIAGNNPSPEKLIRSFECGGRFFECTLNADAVAKRIKTILLHSKLGTDSIKIVLPGNPDFRGPLFELSAE